MRKLSIFTGALLALAFTGAQADPYLTGNVTTPNWTPGAAGGVPIGGGVAADLLFAATPGTDANGIAYDLVLNLPGSGTPSHGFTSGQTYDWKVADAGFSNPNFPGDNLKLVGPATATDPVSFYIRLSAFGDGLLPEPDGSPINSNRGWAWSTATPAVFTSATSFNVIGNFYDNGLGLLDWTEGQVGNLALTDAGSGGPTDGIWGVEATGIAAGSYACGYFKNNDFDGPKIVQGGFGGADFAFTVNDPSDTVKFVLDTRTGRGNVIVESAIVIAPGLYASIPGVTTSGFNAADIIPTAGGPAAGVYAKKYTVATAGSYIARVLNHDGNSVVANYPDSGGYPFTTTAPNQEVIVILDTNTYSDGYLPASNIVTVLNDNPRQSTLGTVTEIQGVGNWQSRILLGLGSDFNNNDDDSNLTETGVGTKVYTGSFPFGAGANVDPVTFKAVGRIPEFASLITSGDWSLQFGGAGEGFTINGNNDNLELTGPYTTGTTLSMTVDIVTGRMAGNLTATPPAAPVRPAFLSNVTAVEDWSNY